MKILVAVKQVIAHNIAIQVKLDNSGIETNNIKMSINPFDEIAVEEAIRLREKGVASEVVVVSAGGKDIQQTLRSALAMGADRALLVQTDAELQPLAVAKILQAVVAEEEPQLVLLGKQAIDDDSNQTGQMLAGLLKWGQGTNASQLIVAEEKNEVQVTREVDLGLEQISLTLPAVITTDLRLNTPRYIKLPNIMKAKRKPLKVITVDALGVDVSSRLETLKVEEPPQRQAGRRLDNVDELIDKLQTEAQVI